MQIYTYNLCVLFMKYIILCVLCLYLRCVCYLQGSCPPRAVWVEEGCGRLQGASCRRNLLRPDHSWHRSIHLDKPELSVNIQGGGHVR